MMIRFFIVALVCTTMHMSFCMEKGDDKQKSFEELPMTKIGSWEEVKQFVGIIVAYTTDITHFEDNASYPLNTCSSTKYAYIDRTIFCFPSHSEEKLENGYKMGNLIHSNANPSFYVLLNSFIADGKLAMRSVTHEEIDQIRKAINKRKAKFSQQIDLKDAMYYLDSTIKHLNETEEVNNSKPVCYLAIKHLNEPSKVNNSKPMYYLESVIKEVR